MRLVADRGALVDARPDAGGVGTGQHDPGAFAAQHDRRPVRDVEGERVLGIAVVGLALPAVSQGLRKPPAGTIWLMTEAAAVFPPLWPGSMTTVRPASGRAGRDVGGDVGIATWARELTGAVGPAEEVGAADGCCEEEQASSAMRPRDGGSRSPTDESPPTPSDHGNPVQQTLIFRPRRCLT